jgi:hypothetical protein
VTQSALVGQPVAALDPDPKVTDLSTNNIDDINFIAKRVLVSTGSFAHNNGRPVTATVASDLTSHHIWRFSLDGSVLHLGCQLISVTIYMIGWRAQLWFVVV